MKTKVVPSARHGDQGRRGAVLHLLNSRRRQRRVRPWPPARRVAGENVVSGCGGVPATALWRITLARNSPQEARDPSSNKARRPVASQAKRTRRGLSRSGPARPCTEPMRPGLAACTRPGARPGPTRATCQHDQPTVDAASRFDARDRSAGGCLRVRVHRRRQRAAPPAARSSPTAQPPWCCRMPSTSRERDPRSPRASPVRRAGGPVRCTSCSMDSKRPTGSSVTVHSCEQGVRTSSGTRSGRCRRTRPCRSARGRSPRRPTRR